MSDLVFATNNKHKLEEMRAIIGDKYKVLSLSDIGCHDDIPETADTIEGNAVIKAKWVAQRYGYDCFADDTALEVEALGGEPGVYSARYAGEPADSERNIDKLLNRLDGVTDRKARFRTAIALLQGDKLKLFEGICPGEIIAERRGSAGFGYDKVFVPDGFDRSFAEMTDAEKNAISHRGRATALLIDYLIRLC